MSAISHRFYLPTQRATEQCARYLAALCQPGDCLLLYGEVGAGKTTFARGFIQAIAQVEEEVVSPTFTLLQTYPLLAVGMVWHADLYRLKHPEELEELGLEEAFESGIALIEWPELIAPTAPESALHVTLRLQETAETLGSGRFIELTGSAAHWQARLAPLQQWIESNSEFTMGANGEGK